MFDSAADFVFMAVCAIKLLPQIQPPMWVWAWTVSIAVIRFISVAYTVFRFQKLKPFHTLLNKTTGVFLFLFPFMMLCFDIVILAVIVCISVTASALEECRRIRTGK